MALCAAMTSTPAVRRPPRKLDAGALERAARHYLERFASSAENLRWVLRRRVERSARTHGTDRAAGASLVDDLVARFQQNGLLDDAHYAAARAAGLARKGGSTRAIRARLRQKGVDRADIDRAIALLTEEFHEPDTAAAAVLVRRRRLGPHRPAPQRAAHRDRDLAALARAGFGYDVARQVIDAPSPEALAAGEA